MGQGPEDRNDWKRGDTQSFPTTCTRCGKVPPTPKLWHCKNLGCPWCVACVAEMRT